MGAALEKLSNLLVPGESVVAWTVQLRLFALLHRRTVVAATSSRFIVVRRGLLGGLQMTDFQWQDLKDARFREGILAAELAAAERNGASVIVGGLDKKSAQRVYVRAQTEEQAWREKNRIRDMEKMRAQSGGVQIGAPVAPGAGGGDPAARLHHARSMLDQGLISDAEYETIKARIVSGL
jgi:hypothetical protein